MKISKKLTLCLSLAIALALSITLSIFSAATPVKASAKESPTEMFTADSVLTSVDIDGMKGLAVNTVNDTATLNGTISGDFEMEYIYSQSGWGSTEIGFYRKSDLTKPVFSVYRRYGADNLGSALVFDNTGAATQVWCHNWVAGNQIDLWMLVQTGEAAQEIETYPAVCSADNYKLPGKVKLVWSKDDSDNDVVSIYITVGWKGQNLRELLMATLAVPDFKDEYVMKISKPVSLTFGGLGDESVVVLSMNGISCSPDEYERTAPVSEYTRIGYDGEYVENGKNVIETGATQLKPFNLYGKYTANGLTYEVSTEQFDSTINPEELGVGEYERTVSYKGVEKTYLFRVLPGYNAKDVFTKESLAEYVTVEGKTIKGVKVVPNTAQATLNGTFKGNFEAEYTYASSCYGEVKFDFIPVGATTPAFSVYRYRGITPEEYDNCGPDGTWYVCWGSALVIKDGKYISEKTAYDTATEAISAAAIAGHNFYPANNTAADNWRAGNIDKWAIAGKLSVELNGNDVTVKHSVGSGNAVTESVEIANFNLPEMANGYTVQISDATGVMDQYSCPDGIVLLSVNGTDLTSGYASYSYKADDVVYTGAADENGKIYLPKNGTLKAFAVNGLNEYYANGWFCRAVDADFASKGLSVKYSTKLEELEVGESQVTVTLYVFGAESTSKEFTVITEQSGKLTFNANGGETEITELYFSEHARNYELPSASKENWKFGGWYTAENVEYTQISGNADVELTAAWYDDVAPEITFADGIDTVTRVYEKAEALAISATDATAYDLATDKTFAQNEIIIEVKAPNGNDFVALKDFDFDSNVYGAYTVRYSATDNWLAVGNNVNNANHTENNTAKVERIIYYAAELPKITLSSELVKKAYVGKNITVPTATAKSGSTDLTVEITASLADGENNSEVLTISGGKVVADKEGTLTIVYSATDACGQIAYERFEITVEKDNEKPVITVAFENKTVSVGENVEIPDATATDNADGNVNVTVEVIFGGNVVANGTFVANNEGLYTIKYTAKDSSGNLTVKTFDVVATGNNSTESGSDNGQVSGGCGGAIGVNATAMLALLGFALIKMKNKKGE